MSFIYKSIKWFDWKQVGHGFTLLVGMILLIASRGFLFTNPSLGSGLLLLFAFLCLTITHLMEAKLYVYPASLLVILSYGVIIFQYVSLPSIPLFFLPMVFFFWILSSLLKRIKLPLAYVSLTAALVYTSYFISLGSLIWLGVFFPYSGQTNQLVPIITLFFYSILYWGQKRESKGLEKKKELWLSFFSFSFFTASLLCLLFSSLLIPKELYSVSLFFLFILYMYIGMWRQFVKLESKQHPLFIIGWIGLIAAPYFALTNTSRLMIIHFLYSLHFLQVYRLQSNHIFPSGGSPLKKEVFLCLSHFSALGYLLVFLWQGFPINSFYLGLALFYAFLYLWAAFSKGGISKIQNRISAYLSGIFLTTAFFEGLLMHAPIYEINWYLILAIPFLWFLFWISFLARLDHLPGLTVTMHEILVLPIIISFLLPLQMQNYSLDFISTLTFGYFFSLLLFSLLSEDKRFLHHLVLVVIFFYYYLIPKGQGLTQGGIHLLFLVPSFITIGVGMWLQKKGSSIAEIFYFGAIVLTVFFLTISRYNSALAIYGLSIYAFLYALAFGYAQQSFPRLGKVIYWLSNLLSLGAILGWFLNRNPFSGIFLGLVLFFIHFFFAYQTKKSYHLWGIALSLAFTYYLGFLRGGTAWEINLLKTIPFIFFIYGCSLWTGFFSTWGKSTFKVTGHLCMIVATLWAVMNARAESVAYIFLFFFISTLIYLVMSRLSPSYEYFFIASAFFSLTFYFGLLIIPGILLSRRLLYFPICYSLLGLGGYLLKRMKGAGCAQPIFETAILVALISSFIPLFYGESGASQKLLFFAALFYLFVAVQLKAEVYLYCSTLSLGLMAYNFSSLAQQRFAQDYIVYGIYLISFLVLFFLSPQHFSWSGGEIKEKGLGADEVILSGWKKIVAYSLLLSSFPCLLIPLYTKKIITYPGFCGRCHAMQPYIEAWQTSSHQQVNCIRCHYNPVSDPPQAGETKFPWSMVKSLASAYTLFPEAEVSDTACLQKGCHAWENIPQQITLRNDRTFDHRFHLHQSNPKQEVRCASCHLQFVDGRQQTVSPKACSPCHKDE